VALGKAGDALLELADEHVFGVAAFEFLEALTHADDGGESEFQRGLGALEDGFVGLGEILAPLAVPTMAWVAPEAAIMGPEISPVKAPSLAQAMFCAPMRMRVP